MSEISADWMQYDMRIQLFSIKVGIKDVLYLKI